MQKYWSYFLATDGGPSFSRRPAKQMIPRRSPMSTRNHLHEDLPIETVASSGRFSGVTLSDNTRPRFRINVSTSSALTPGASITVTLQGEAVEKIASGTVSVRLPTMASMDYAGANKRPYYPAGQSLPVVRKWALSAMNPGDTWSQSFTVSLPPEKGYYDLLVDADIDAPGDARVNPFVIDELQYERWMLVTDVGGGGSMTGLGFDESAFADSIAPVPGPFRIKASRRGATGADGFRRCRDGQRRRGNPEPQVPRKFRPRNDSGGRRGGKGQHV